MTMGSWLGLKRKNGKRSYKFFFFSHTIPLIVPLEDGKPPRAPVKCVADGVSRWFLFRSFFLTFMELTFVCRDPYCFIIILSSRFFPGAGKRALRFALIPLPDPHDLSRRAKRVAGRSDAVLHRFEKAKPNRNGCIVVHPLYP